MKKLTFKEFAERTEHIAKALKIFTPHFTKNITIAFEMYKQILAEEEVQVFVSTYQGGNRQMTPLDDYERPKCPECNIDLRMRLGPFDHTGKQWQSSWFCEKCNAEFYSEKTPQEWMEELKLGEHVQKQ
jgi:hypothetical protein